MYLLAIDKKTGFECKPGAKVRIYDANTGRQFYVHSVKSGRFNLPPGRYLSTNRYKVARPVKWLISLPARERFTRIKQKPKLTFGVHANKCIIFPSKDVIVADRSFFNAIDNVQRTFVLFHELGHYRYKTELYCDLYAAKNMLRIGFNPSQIAAASASTLGEHKTSVKRKFDLYRYLKNAK